MTQTSDKERLAEEYEDNCEVDCEYGYNSSDIKAAFRAGYDAGVKSPEVEALFEALDICHKSIKASLILQDIGNARVPRRSLQHSALKNEDGENLVRTLDVAKSALDAYKARLGKG